MKRRLHDDWPEVDVAAKSWNMSAPVRDLFYALDDATAYTATFPPERLSEKISLAEVDSVSRYHVSYHGEAWGPQSDNSGTELDMYIVGRLVDGRWFSVVAWNDYTGWGCQDGSEVRVGLVELDVVTFGLDEAGRKLLGYH